MVHTVVPDVVSACSVNVSYFHSYIASLPFAPESRVTYPFPSQDWAPKQKL